MINEAIEPGAQELQSYSGPLISTDMHATSMVDTPAQPLCVMTVSWVYYACVCC